MDRTTKALVAVGGLLGGVIIWQRRHVAGLLRLAARRAEEARIMAGGTVSRDVIARFRQYRIGEILERYRGPIPWALAAAIVEIESGGDPGIYNYYKGGVRLVGRVEPGTPPPPEAHAVGLFQILQKYARDKVPPGTTGYDVDAARLTDPSENARAALQHLARLWERVKFAPPPGRYALLYYGHNQGGAALQRLIEAYQKMGATDFDDACRRVGANDKARSVAKHVAARVSHWERLEPELSGRQMRLVS